MSTKRTLHKKSYTSRIIGFAAIIFAILLLGFPYTPLVVQNFRYALTQLKNNSTTEIIPIDTNFGIVIPKIHANAKIIERVNPYNSKEYQKALSLGVAHAGGSALPGSLGNVFLFSHSSLNFYEAARFNSVFYLIDKLEAGDQIFLYFQNTKYSYTISHKKIISANEISYLTSPERYKEMLTLMTCWPTGTSLKRLIVTAHRN